MDQDRKLQLKLEVVLRQLTHQRQQGLGVFYFIISNSCLTYSQKNSWEEIAQSWQFP